MPARSLGAAAPVGRDADPGRALERNEEGRPGSAVKPGPLREGGYVGIGFRSRGKLVTFVQRRVTRSGFPTVVDGIFGPRTEAAVRRFQADRRLVVDGIVGRQTMSVLTPAEDDGVDAPQSRLEAPRSSRGVTISSPAGSAVSGTVVVRARPERAAAPVRRVIFYVDGKRRGIDRRPGYAYLMATRELSNGRHRLTVRAFYASGRVARRTKVVTVRNTTAARPGRPTAPAPSKPAPDPNAPVPPSPGQTPPAGQPPPPTSPPPQPQVRPAPVAPPAIDVGSLTRDFELGSLTGWQLVQRVADDRIRTVRSPVRQGVHAARFEVRHGDHVNGEPNSRAELGYTDDLASEGEEQTYSWSTMLASDYPSASTWQDVVQWKNQGTGSPPLQMKVEGEKISLAAGSQLNWRNVWSAPLVRGEWLDFTFRVKWSSDPNVGWVELWYRDRHVLERYPMATLYPGLSNYLKIGLYRNASITATGVVYHDDVRVSTQ